jgi:hypothetical protein
MNQSQQQQQEKPSFLEWYSYKTGMFMDKLCFSYIQEFDGVSLYEERKEQMRRSYASYELPGDFPHFQESIHRTETLPIQNIWRTIDDDDDDDEDWRSTTSDEVLSQLFRPKREHSTSSLKSGANDHESYQYLLRMKPQNYIHGCDEDRLDFQQLKPTYHDDCLGKKTLSIGNLGKEDSMRNLGCNPPTRKQVTSKAA